MIMASRGVMMVKNRLYFLLDTFLLLLIVLFALLQIVIIGIEGKRKFFKQSVYTCLLYTSDAADD